MLLVFKMATPRQRLQATGLAVCMGAFLAVGFIPVSQNLVERFHSPWLSAAAFALLAAAFHFSFPRPRLVRAATAWGSFPLAFLIAGVYGAFDGGPAVYRMPWNGETQLALAWVCVFVPLGEELLFRGWVYSVAHRLWKGSLATATNPLPMAVWVSALAFSMWHVQNAGMDAWGQVFFQMAFALPAGLWLGWLRWKSGSLLPPLLAHFLLNFATLLA